MKFGYLIEPPFNDRDDSGEVIGADVVVAKAINSALNLGPFEPIETDFASLLPGLKAGHWRMTTGLLATKDRMKFARFTRPIWSLSDGLLVRSGDAQRFRSYTSLAETDGAVVGVVRDQEQHNSARAFGVQETNIRVYRSYPEAAAAVQTREVDAFASICMAHRGFLAPKTGVGLEAVEVPVSESSPSLGAFAVSLEDARLLEDVDAFLAEYLGSDDHKTKMLDYGFREHDIARVIPEA